MARHTQLLHPITQKVIPIRHSPGVLPPGSLLLRKSKKKIPHLPSDLTQEATEIEQGQHIYVYKNIRTNQVVYSLTRHLDFHPPSTFPIPFRALEIVKADFPALSLGPPLIQNTAAIKQLPFLGKKTVPAKLRKDLWLPFWLATFPSPIAGLNAYRKLREFRLLHEVAYPRSVVADPKNPKCNLPKRLKGKALMDQKANSVADLAAVLFQQERGPNKERLLHYERVKNRFDRLKSQGSKKVRRKEGPLDVEVEYKGVEGVRVYWEDIKDAEFAQTWPKDVVHSLLERARYTAAWPAAREIAGEVESEEETGKLAGGEDEGKGGAADHVKDSGGALKGLLVRTKGLFQQQQQQQQTPEKATLMSA